jgi:hypothetical protein
LPCWRVVDVEHRRHVVLVHVERLGQLAHVKRVQIVVLRRRVGWHAGGVFVFVVVCVRVCVRVHARESARVHEQVRERTCKRSQARQQLKMRIISREDPSTRNQLALTAREFYVFRQRRQTRELYKKGAFPTSFAMVKLNASIGFQQMAFVRMARMIFLIGVAARTSYRAMLRSSAAVASTLTSTGLNLTVVTVSAPHPNEVTGSDRDADHKSTTDPDVAKRSCRRWWSTPVKKVLCTTVVALVEKRR